MKQVKIQVLTKSGKEYETVKTSVHTQSVLDLVAEVFVEQDIVTINKISELLTNK